MSTISCRLTACGGLAAPRGRVRQTVLRGQMGLCFMECQMNKRTMEKTISELKEVKQSYEETCKSIGEKEIGGWLQEWLEDHPEIQQISWTQYTPYFNDGDECTFGVNWPS